MSALMVKRGRRYSRASKDEILDAAAELQVADIPGVYVKSPNAAQEFLCNVLGPREAECFCALWLDSRHRVLAFDIMFRGTIDRASIHPREVMRRALERNAAAVVLAHNHPSGMLDPSCADELITARLREALSLIDIRVVDHIIVGRGDDGQAKPFSFSEHGLI